MKPERSTRVTWMMAAFLGAAAIVFDDPSFFLATFSLVLFSAILALRFRLRMHRIVMSARVTRTAERRVVQQGSAIAITTGFYCSPDPGLTIRIRDVLPPAALADPANASAVVGSDGSATIRYSLTPVVAGRTGIQGIEVTVADPFYTASLRMASAPFRGPELEVNPHAAYERSRALKDFGAREKDMPSIYRGYGIRSIREYLQGDDLRSIDWKMTAKHDRMFIREYTAVENFPPLIVLDLPDRSFPVPDDHMAKVISNVTGETVTALRNCGSVSLVLISGVNIVDILLDETDLRQIMEVIRESAHPHFRLHHAYRWKNRASMRRFVRKLGSTVSLREEEENRRFEARIAQIYRNSLAGPWVPVFSKQVKQLLHSLQIEEILFYSFFEGDLSHVRELAFQAQMRRIRLKPRTVGGQDGSRFSALKKMQDMEPVEVIP